jgi:glycosyltransferase involved in cell wall biosynthesis
MKHFPKILIIGQPFNKKTGGGITMSNLFQGWPKDRLAVASNENLESELDTSFCEQYYQLGYNNKLHPFPLNLILPKIYCGPVFPSIKSETVQNQLAKPGKYKTIYKLLSSFLKFIGVYNILYNIKLTPDFKKWLIEFNPDIVYSQLSTLELIRFMTEIHRQINKPLAVHMMDDWPETINKPGLFYFYWKRVIDNEFRQLLDKSTIFMSICDTMSEEYKMRYNHEFTPFHNPLEIKNWLPVSKNNWIKGNKFKILYAGRIGLGMKNTIIDVANAVAELSKEFDSIVFEIQTADISEIKNKIKFNENIKWIRPIEYSKLPEKFSSVDLLLIPIDFDHKSIKFMKYSFPTKISEYMITGTPILVYADKVTAVVNYAIKGDWGYVVNDNDVKVLKDAILKIFSDANLRKSLGERAKALAIQNEDAYVVRDKFRIAFILDKD